MEPCYLNGMTKKTNPRKDFTQRAFDVFQKAIGEAELEEEPAKGKADNQKGVKAQTEKLAPKAEKSEKE